MSLHHMLRAAAGNAGPSDPYFEYNTLLLTGNGTNGAQNNTFLDSSTNNFTITRNGNTTQGTFSPYGNLWSNYFDGNGDYLTVAPNAALPQGTANFTMEAWVYPTVNATSAVMNLSYATIGALFIGIVSGTWYVYSNGAPLVTGSAVTFNAWTHVAATRNGNTFTLWINGVSAGTGTSAGSLSLTNPVSIGAGYDGTYPLTGYISNVRFNSNVLYSSTFTPSTTPLTAVSGTSLLTCQSNRFIDNSSNNFTLTVAGNTSVQRFSPFNPTAPYSASTIGGSGYFDGTGDYLTVPDNAALQPPNGDFTYELWWYPTSVSGTQEIFTKGTGVQIYLSGGVMNCALSSNNSSTYFIAASFGAPILNAWNHIALVRSGTTYYGYLNGARTTLGTSASYPGTGTDNVVIAAYAAGQFPTFGYLSDARYTTSAVYTTSPATVPTTPLTAISGTQLLTNFTNAGIPDAAMMNDLETVGNAQVSTSVVKYGTGSLAFDGTGDYLQWYPIQNTAFGTGDFTVEMWVYPATSISDKYLLDNRNASQTGTWAFGDGLTGSPGRLDWFNGSSVITSTNSSIPTGTWSHVAYVRNGTDGRIYVNGVAVSSATDTTNYTIASTSAVIGARYTNVSNFNGYIDDLRITKGLARYTANFTPPTAALPVY